MPRKINPIPFLALTVCLVSTFFVWQFTDRNLDQRARARFDNQRKSIQLRIQKRLDLYVSMLYGVRALFAASREVDRAEWSAFMKSQAILDRYPGLQSIAFVERVSADGKEAFLSRVRFDTALNYGGYPDFAIRPNKDPLEYFVVNYLYPFEENETLFGLDMGSDPVFRQTLETARDSGEPEFTPSLVLRPRREAGFLIFMPVYRNHLSIKTTAERRLALKGFAVGAVSAERLFSDLSDDAAVYKNIDFEIFDGHQPTPNNLLYDSNDSFSLDNLRTKPRFGVSVPLNVRGRAWMLRFTALSGFQLDENEKHIQRLVLGSGFLFSFLIFGILYSQNTARSKAVKLAAEMTVDLRREIEERKKMQEELLKLSRAQSEFTSTMSHELRTPLAVIKESLAMLGDGTVAPVRPEQKDLIDTAKGNVERLSQLINAVLDYQKLDSQSMKFHRAPHDVNAFVKEVVKELTPLSNSRGLELRTELEPALPRISFDKDRLTQVLMNLIHNAVKFSEKGTVAVRTSRVDGGAVRVSVQDEGIGIRAEDMPKLFKSFSQTAEGHRKTGGTGLGLAISKKIIEAHGGSLRAESVFGQGSDFYFILPVSS